MDTRRVSFSRRTPGAVRAPAADLAPKRVVGRRRLAGQRRCDDVRCLQRLPPRQGVRRPLIRALRGRSRQFSRVCLVRVPRCIRARRCAVPAVRDALAAARLLGRLADLAADGRPVDHRRGREPHAATRVQAVLRQTTGAALTGKALGPTCELPDRIRRNPREEHAQQCLGLPARDAPGGHEIPIAPTRRRIGRMDSPRRPGRPAHAAARRRTLGHLRQ